MIPALKQAEEPARHTWADKLHRPNSAPPQIRTRCCGDTEEGTTNFPFLRWKRLNVVLKENLEPGGEEGISEFLEEIARAKGPGLVGEGGEAAAGTLDPDCWSRFGFS